MTEKDKFLEIHDMFKNIMEKFNTKNSNYFVFPLSDSEKSDLEKEIMTEIDRMMEYNALQDERHRKILFLYLYKFNQQKIIKEINEKSFNVAKRLFFVFIENLKKETFEEKSREILNILNMDNINISYISYVKDNNNIKEKKLTKQIDAYTKESLELNSRFLWTGSSTKKRFDISKYITNKISEREIKNFFGNPNAKIEINFAPYLEKTPDIIQTIRSILKEAEEFQQITEYKSTKNDTHFLNTIKKLLN